MADAVAVKTLRDGPDAAAFILSCASDGTGESKVQKIDISAIRMAATKVRIRKLKWSVQGMAVSLYFDHSTDDLACTLVNQGSIEEDDDAPITDPASAGGTGDILLSSAVPATTTGNGYTIYLEIQKVA